MSAIGFVKHTGALFMQNQNAQVVVKRIFALAVAILVWRSVRSSWDSTPLWNMVAASVCGSATYFLYLQVGDSAIKGVKKLTAQWR